MVAIIDLPGIDRSHEVVWNCAGDLAETRSDPAMIELLWIAVDEKRIEADGEAKSTSTCCRLHILTYHYN